MPKRLVFIASLTVLMTLVVKGQNMPKVTENPVAGYYPLATAQGVAAICTDAQDYPVVGITAEMLADDVERVTGKRPFISHELSKGAAIVAGTLGKSRLIDNLVKSRKIDVSSIRGKWESFIITTTQHPKYHTPLLIIVGSDRRGTAFGLTSLSEAIGVSPWYWWADITPVHKATLYVEPSTFVQEEPSVQYRGIFINDERFGGWARWAEQTFEKETGKVGPKTYRRVFELLLRLKANYLWPAMHPGTQAFNDNPENARLADDYAIVMGSSHCEQMLRNNEGEWKAVNQQAQAKGEKGLGDFNYITNRKTMQDYWETRVKTNGRYENTYTLGLRGIHDYPMEGANSTQERVALMQKAIDDQRDMLRRNINKPIEEIPQVLCTYEEVLDAYHNGLQVPDDVTLLWSDDKHGYCRNLCNPDEMQRRGGAGIYYHLSYHGDPASWIWLSPLSPAFLSTELTKAYTYGARKIWVFNVGDIKPAEKEISFVMDLAWDIDRWKPAEAHNYMEYWAGKTFGQEYAKEIADIQADYYRLQASGKDAHVWFVNYTESQIAQRIEIFSRLSARVEKLAKQIPPSLSDAYFELVEYPVRGAAMINEYQLLARRSMVRTTAGDSLGAVTDANRVKQMFQALNKWTRHYNEDIQQGKWREFFNWQPYHWFRSDKIDPPVAKKEITEAVSRMPKPRFLNVANATSGIGSVIESEMDAEVPLWIEALTPIRNFSKAPEDNVFCHVSTDSDSFNASATPINNVWHAPYVGPMWSRVGTLHLKKGHNVLRLSEVKPDARIDRIFVGLYPPFAPEPRLRIPASDYTRKHNSQEGCISQIPGLGYTDGILVQPFDTPAYDAGSLDLAPFVEYDLDLQEMDSIIDIHTLPTLHVYEGRDARFAVQLGDAAPQVFSIHANDFTAEWRWNVLRGYASRQIPVSKAGHQRLRIYLLDPGIVLQEILVYSSMSQELSATGRLYLNKGWTFGMARQPNRHPAVVPGVVHTDLLREGLIEDPYIGLNERSVQWVDKEDWVYETTFQVSEAITGKDRIELCFEGLDTYADVYLNDKKIIEADNMFRIWRAEVKPLLKSGSNVLRVYFHSPVKVDMPKWEQHPYRYGAANDQSENGGLLDRKISVFARKAGYHYGWDWGPRLVTSGIWRDVYLHAWSEARITNTHLRQREVSIKKAVITDVVEIESSHDISHAVVSVTDACTGLVMASKKCQLHKGMNTVEVEFTVKNPRLWWCNGLGKPELYTFTTQIATGGQIVTEHQDRIGLRSVKLVTEPDANGQKQFYFILNGIPVFAKGTNYIPQDNFLTNVTPERYRQTLQDAVLANMNMIRVWGGGIYEDNLFYDLCDEMGLMVWQDFMFACSTYPAEGGWLENVRQEAVDNIRRLRNHPSIVLWCGGNECMDAWYNWGWKVKMEKTDQDGARIVEQQQEHLYYDVLQEITSQQIPEGIYTPGSPFTVRGKGSDGENGDRHFYGVGHRRMPVSSYNQEKAHFFSEYGMQSFPEYTTIKKFAPDPVNHDIGSEMMMSHQRGGVNANKTIEWYVNSEYGKPKDFSDFLYTSQLLQGDAMRTAIEAHRRDKPHCMGSLLWQHNDCWPVASWSTRDYYGRWKAAHYMVRYAFEDVICSAVVKEDSLQAFVISDLPRMLKGTLQLTVYTLDGKLVCHENHSTSIPANTSTLALELPLSRLLRGQKREDVVINLCLKTTSGKVHQGNYFLCLQKDLRLQPANVELKIEAADGGCFINARSGKFVRALCLTIGNNNSSPDNNYFDLLPEVPVRIFVRTPLSPNELKYKLSLQSMNKIVTTYSIN